MPTRNRHVIASALLPVLEQYMQERQLKSVGQALNEALREWIIFRSRPCMASHVYPVSSVPSVAALPAPAPAPAAPQTTAQELDSIINFSLDI